MDTPIITIDYNNFILGEGQDTRRPDRGIGKESYSVNLYKEKGTLYFQEAATDRSTNLEGDVLAITNDPRFGGHDNILIDNEGKYYTLTGSTLTKRQTDSTNTYEVGTTDILRYRSSVYATSTTQMIQVQGLNLTTLDDDFWTVTRGHTALTVTRHPLEVVEDTLYIGDLNMLHTWDDTTSVQAAMTLPNGINITSLRKHPDGRHLIVFAGVTINYDHTKSGGGKIYIVDTVNLEFIREIDIEAQIEGSRNVGGVIYVTYGDKIGYFNGDGIEWLRDLTSGQTAYSHQLAHAEEILLVRDGSDLLAYGDLGQGKVWWRAYRTAATSYATFTAIGYKGNDVALVGYANSGGTEKLEEISIKNAGTQGAFYSNHYLTGGEVAVRRIEVDHTETPASGTHAFITTLYDGVGNEKHTVTTTYTDNPQQMTRIDLDAFLRDIQLKLAPSSGAMGFRQIRIYGESIE